MQPIAYEDVRELTIGDLPPLSLPAFPAGSATEAQWLAVYYRAALEIRDHLELTARVRPTRRLAPRTEGVLMGHMVRLFKCYDTFLLLTAAGRSEIAYGFWRLIAETGINLLFLLEKGTPAVVDGYIRADLKSNQQLLELGSRWLQKEIGGVPLMTDDEFDALDGQIRQSFDEAAVDPAVHLDRNWGGVGHQMTDQKAKAVRAEAAYELIFRTGSRMLHGTWQDLKQFHLRRGVAGERYEPNTKYKSPDTNVLYLPSKFSLRAGMFYLIWIRNDRRHPLALRLYELSKWFDKADDAHREFLERVKNTSVQ